MVNLLPQPSRASVVLSYRLRLAAVLLGMLSVAFIIALGALAPSYFAAVAAAEDTARQEAVADQSLAEENLAEAARAEHAGELLAKAIQGQMRAPRPSLVLLALLKEKPSGISVITVNYSSGTSGANVAFSGIAATRDELLAFKQALAAVPGVTSVNLPIDALASASDIDFNLNLTYAPAK